MKQEHINQHLSTVKIPNGCDLSYLKGYEDGMKWALNQVANEVINFPLVNEGILLKVDKEASRIVLMNIETGNLEVRQAEDSWGIEWKQIPLKVALKYLLKILDGDNMIKFVS